MTTDELETLARRLEACVEDVKWLGSVPGYSDVFQPSTIISLANAIEEIAATLRAAK